MICSNLVLLYQHDRHSCHVDDAPGNRAYQYVADVAHATQTNDDPVASLFLIKARNQFYRLADKHMMNLPNAGCGEFGLELRERFHAFVEAMLLDLRPANKGGNGAV